MPKRAQPGYVLQDHGILKLRRTRPMSASACHGRVIPVLTPKPCADKDPGHGLVRRDAALRRAVSGSAQREIRLDLTRNQASAAPFVLLADCGALRRASSSSSRWLATSLPSWQVPANW